MTNQKQSPLAFLSPRLLLVALNFLTALRLPGAASAGARQLGGAVGFFPLVGLLLGALLLGAQRLLAAALPAPLAAALLLSLWILLSGALHLDGFLDACDGLFGGRSPEQRLHIMRDEAIGAFAFAGGAILLLLKFTALQETAPAALLLAPTLGRWAMALCIVAFPYARPEGLGSAMKANADWRQALLASLVAIAAAWFAAGWLGLLAVGALLVLVILLGRFVLGLIPGFTGDLYGAACELGETLVLLIFVMAIGI